MASLLYDDTNLRGMIDALDEKQRVKALRGALRRAAGKVRKAARLNLAASGLANGRSMAKAVRSSVWRKSAGFKITVAPKRGGTRIQDGFHTNKRGESKPVPMWAESGTKKRTTKSATKIWTRSRKSHPTGRMKRYGFMAKTKSQIQGSTNSFLKESIVQSVKSIAKKYGCY